MASPAASSAEVRAALRAVLRAVDRHVTRINGSTQWRKEVVAQFRAGPRSPTGTDGASVPTSSPSHDAATRPIAPAGSVPTPPQALALAREWAALMNNIARHKELLLTYNIGLDVDERTKRMVEATARRVGFALPQTGEDAAAGKQQKR